MKPEGLEITDNRNANYYQIKANGDLIITNAKKLQGYIDSAIDGGVTNITMDLTNIEYIDSFGIGVVVKTKSQVDKKKGRLRVLVNSTLLNLFEKCHLDDYINLELQNYSGEEKTIYSDDDL